MTSISGLQFASALAAVSAPAAVDPLLGAVSASAASPGVPTLETAIDPKLFKAMAAVVTSFATPLDEAASPQSRETTRIGLEARFALDDDAPSSFDAGRPAVAQHDLRLSPAHLARMVTALDQVWGATGLSTEQGVARIGIRRLAGRSSDQPTLDAVVARDMPWPPSAQAMALTPGLDEAVGLYMIWAAMQRRRSDRRRRQTRAALPFTLFADHHLGERGDVGLQHDEQADEAGQRNRMFEDEA